MYIFSTYRALKWNNIDFGDKKPDFIVQIKNSIDGSFLKSASCHGVLPPAVRYQTDMLEIVFLAWSYNTCERSWKPSAQGGVVYFATDVWVWIIYYQREELFFSEIHNVCVIR